MRRTRRKRPSTFSASRSVANNAEASKCLPMPRAGLTEQLLLARGFSVEMLSSLVLATLAIAVIEPMGAHRGTTLMVERICITDAGRMSLKG